MSNIDENNNCMNFDKEDKHNYCKEKGYNMSTRIDSSRKGVSKKYLSKCSKSRIPVRIPKGQRDSSLATPVPASNKVIITDSDYVQVMERDNENDIPMTSVNALVAPRSSSCGANFPVQPVQILHNASSSQMKMPQQTPVAMTKETARKPLQSSTSGDKSWLLYCQPQPQEDQHNNDDDEVTMMDDKEIKFSQQDDHEDKHEQSPVENVQPVQDDYDKTIRNRASNPFDEQVIPTHARRNNPVFTSLPSPIISNESSKDAFPENTRERAITSKSTPQPPQMTSRSRAIPLRQQEALPVKENQLQLKRITTNKRPHDDDDTTTNNNNRYAICRRNEAPKEDKRIPSFKQLQAPRSQRSSRENSTLSSSHNFQTSRYSGGGGGGGTMLPKRISPRNLAATTYEDIFYRKKAFSERGSAFIRSNSNANGNNSNSGYRNAQNTGHFQAHAEQRRVFTKIVTETNYEYEDDEDERGSRNDNRRNAKSKSNDPCSTAIVAKDKQKNNRVTINAKPSILPASSIKEETERENDKHEDLDLQQSSSKTKSEIPRMILPGHGDPHLELPDPEMKSDAGESCFEEEEKRESIRRNEPCDKCKVYKNMLAQSESTVRYLTQMLDLKDTEIKSLHNKYGTGNSTLGMNSNSNVPPLNPLLMKEKNGEENGTCASTASRDATTTTGTATTPRACPILDIKFDLDEFILKYFRNLISTKDFQDSPFTQLQLYHVAISARDCMAQNIKKKIRHAEGVLRQKYDLFVSMKSSSTEPLDDSVYFAVLDSYRRFVRYIYHYFKESIKHVENFEHAHLSQNKDTKIEGPRCTMIYSREQVVTIDGKQYTAVVIPIAEIAGEDKSN